MNGVSAMPSDHKLFTMPSDMAGPCCSHCETVLPTVYRTERVDQFIFRDRICPNCGKKNTTLERTVERPD